MALTTVTMYVIRCDHATAPTRDSDREIHDSTAESMWSEDDAENTALEWGWSVRRDANRGDVWHCPACPTWCEVEACDALAVDCQYPDH